eukprot:CAMPEP_0115596790 /NCGR_PEP_ID=MMETSP0272-20121206/13017_1 /TAXON_ID=71861 /ORGANISM="Scrippsiella trochoidea, Strain CCMP3099" /LENGTH=600 /DNA_ID=CAMNT_0003032139 /DNA_START=1 /DNA_END=1803 /DNA_ORIENTATION=+
MAMVMLSKLPDLPDSDRAVIVKRTFVDFESTVQSGLRRSLSCGDLPRDEIAPSLDAEQVEVQPCHTGSSGRDAHESASSHATGSTAAQGASSASHQLASDGDECSSGLWPLSPRCCTQATSSPRHDSPCLRIMNQPVQCDIAIKPSARENLSDVKGGDILPSDREAEVASTSRDNLVIPRAHSDGILCSEDEGAPAAEIHGPQVEVWTEALMADIWEAVAGVEQVLEQAHCRINNASLSLAEAVKALLHLARSADRNVACDMPEWQASEPRFVELIQAIRELIRATAEPSLLSQMFWSLGRLNANSGDVATMLEHLAAEFQPPALVRFTSVQLSDTLLGLGRIADKSSCCRPPAKRIARLILVESLGHLSSFSPHSLAGAIWAVAKLRLAAVGMAGTFVKSCVAHLCREGCISKLSSHSVATTLWSIAKLRLDTREVSSLCTAVAREVDPESLRSFVTVDLSISLWAMAKMIRKCIRRSESSRSQPQSSKPCYGAEASKSASSILVALTQEAFSRGNAEFSQQALTNISWALTTLELTGHIGAAASEGAAIPCDGSPEDCSIVNASCATCPAAADATAAAKTACLGVQLGDVQLAAAVVA